MNVSKTRSGFIAVGILACSLLLGSSTLTRAAIVESSHWAMGEAGTIVGTAPQKAQDSINSDGALNNFNNAFAVTYLTASPPPLSGSTTYMHTAGGSSSSGQWIFGTGSIAQSIPANNWGIELWIRSTDTASITSQFRSAISLSSSSSGHLALEPTFVGGKVYWDVNRSGVSNMIIPRNATTEVVDNQWYNLALINDAGTTRFYVNGVLAGSSSTATVNDGFIHLGIKPSSGGFNFVGDFDELRFFTFAPGQFSTSDLYINNPIPEPSTIAFLLCGGLGLVLIRRQRMAS